MNILFVVLSPIDGNTSGIISNIGLINGLLELNNHVDILTTKLYGNNIKNEAVVFSTDNYSLIYTEESNLYKDVVDSRTSRSKVKRFFLNTLRKTYYSFKILDNKTQIAKKIDANILKNKKYDLVISASDPKSSHLAVNNLKKQGVHFNKWLQYWGDPLYADITRTNIWPNFVIKKVEKNIISKADKICYVSPFTLGQQEKLFPMYAKNMFFLPLPYVKKRMNEHALSKDNIRIGYFGDYNSNVRNITKLYDACNSLQNVYLTIAGGTDISLKNTDHVTIYPRLPQEKIDILEDQMDIIVCILNKKGNQIPGKIYYAAATNKAILVLIDGDNKDAMLTYLKSFNRYVITYNQTDSIINSIKNIIRQGKKYEPCDKLSPLNIASELLKNTFK